MLELAPGRRVGLLAAGRAEFRCVDAARDEGAGQSHARGADDVVLDRIADGDHAPGSAMSQRGEAGGVDRRPGLAVIRLLSNHGRPWL